MWQSATAAALILEKPIVNGLRKYTLPGILVACTMGGLYWFSSIATKRDFSQLENVLLQFFILLFGLVGTFLAGQQAGKDSYRTFARERYRRLLSLYAGTFDNYIRLREIRHTSETMEQYRLAIFEVIGQKRTMLQMARDCLDSWNDVAREEVGDLHESFFQEKEQEGES